MGLNYDHQLPDITSASDCMSRNSKKKFKTGVKWLAWSGVLASVSAGGWLV